VEIIMVRKLTPSQFRNEVRRLEQKQRQAINDYNRKVKKVNDHNKRVVDNYNREVRAHNARVRSNRQRLINELNRLGLKRTTTTTVRYVKYRTSVQTLHQSFVRVEAAADQGTWTAGDELFDLVEGEAANSVAVLNALLDEPAADSADDPQLRLTTITTELTEIDPDLDARWRGALFALNPENPDAARHFCTSTREIFVRILDQSAPDEQVLATFPNITLTENNQVPRREKIRYCLERRGQQDTDLLNFVDDDVDNVMELFRAFNPATHGEAGRYDLSQLGSIKTRAEGAIQFLHRIVT
jgi:hypothetical protein